MKATRLLFLTLFVTLFGSSLFAQLPTGLPNNSSFQKVSSVETIDLGTLNIHLEIPFYTKRGRGIPFYYGWEHDNNFWQVTPGSDPCCTTWSHSSDNGEGLGNNLVSPKTMGVQASDKNTVCSDGTNSTTWYNFAYVDDHYTAHAVPNLAVNTKGCTYATSGSGYDEQGDLVKVTVNNTSSVFTTLTVTTPDGTQLEQTSLPYQLTDKNGNTISTHQYTDSKGYGDYYFVDTLGKTVLTQDIYDGYPHHFTYTGESGNETVTENFGTTYTVQTNSACANTQFGPQGSWEFPTSIVYPDGSSYQFGYEPTPGYPSATTGRLAKLVLPTGATITYAYSGGQGGFNCDGTPNTLKRTTPDGTWTYVHAMPNSAHVSTTTVTDPAGNETSYWFYQNGGSAYEIERVVHTGSSTALETVVTCYNGQTTNCNTAPNAITTVSRRTMSITLGSVTRKVDEFYNSYGQLTERDDYDWGASSPTRKHVLNYGSYSGTCNSTGVLPGSNIRPVCADVVMKNDGTWVAATLYYYDQTTPQSSGITTQHGAAPGGSSRGNPTEISRYVSGTGNYLATTNAFYDTGNLYQTTDPNGDQYTFTYGDCAGAFLTSVQEPASLSKSATWDCNGAVPISATDEAGATTTINHSGETFWRASSISDPLGQVTTFSYTPTSVESAMNFATSSTVDVITTVDGLGRPHVVQRRTAQGATSFDSVETDYNNVGEVSRATVPYSTTTVGGTNSTVAATTYTYDGLGRVGVVTSPSGATKVSTYTNNQVFVQVSPQFGPTGTNTASGYQYDGLGRLTDVCEGNGGQAWGVAPCIVSNWGGYWTHYQYDTLGNMLTATLNYTSANPQTRTFTYDGLGRLLTENNPETGTTSYAYDTNGDLHTRTDALNHVLTYTYGAFHRLSAVSAQGTVCRNFYYDTNRTEAGATNTKGRMSSATTSNCSGTVYTDEYFSYDADGRQTDLWEKTPNSGGLYHVTEQYFPNGTPNTLVAKNSSGSLFTGLPTITYSVDGEGRPTLVTAGSGQDPVTAASYNVAGQLTSLTLGSGDSDAYTYDGNTGQMTQYKFSINGSNVTGDLTWSTNGTLQKLIVADPFNSANAQTCTYAYDPRARLSSANCGTPWSQTFTYDFAGNLKKSGSLSFQPNYADASGNNSNRYYSGLTGLSYDADGNLLNDSFHSYTWDAFGSVTAIDSYPITHDAFGRIVEFKSSPSYQVLYAPSGIDLAVLNGQSVFYGKVPLPSGGRAVFTGSGLNDYTHVDWQGSARFGSTTSRGMLFDMAYAPYGEIYAKAGGGSAEAFTNQFRDIVGDEWDFLYRQEHSSQGRWISPDPAGLAAVDPTNPQTWNRYAYVGGNPLSGTDPMGLVGDDPCPVSACVTATPIDVTIDSGLYCSPGTPCSGGYFVEEGELDPFATMSYNSNTGQYTDNTKPGPLPAANNGTNPIVPANPCNGAGNAPDPSVYQAKGQAASTNEFKDLYYLFQFRAGGGLDAQPQGASPAYANYAYGVYMSAAGYTLDQALAGADIYAQYRSSYRPGTVMDPNHPFTPMANVMNITYGFTAQQMGTICHK